MDCKPTNVVDNNKPAWQPPTLTTIDIKRTLNTSGSLVDLGGQTS